MRMHALVINCSAPHYNLGAAKCASWLRACGVTVTEHDGDPGLFGYGASQVWLSVIFSWHAPLAVEIAWRYTGHSDVYCGGPGMFALGRWWQQQTGLVCHRGLDARFESQRGAYRMTFASRGCPVNCSFCLVPRLEGTTFTLDWDFQPAPILCDNNLSALPVPFQRHILTQYEATGTRLSDANSGFEPRSFDAETYQRWAAVLRGPWRFALDTMSELDDVRRMMQLVCHVPAKRKQVYVLIGNEPFAACYERCTKVLEWGGEPYVQPLLPLNALTRRAYKIAYDWSPQRLRDMQRYYNRHLWRALPLHDYHPRQGEPPPFAEASSGRLLQRCVERPFSLFGGP